MPSGSSARPRRVARAASDTHLPETAKAGEAKRRFVLQVIHPGLAGLTDGTVSTLTPAFAAHNLWNTFLVGLAASLDAGISTGFTKALKGDGKLPGRGTPLMRGLTTVANCIGHIVPSLH